ncbi:hypothetical protein LTR66_010797 [Elasticomyces elasticus]|nr:hypothetical protein LTR66_010797 [Elasticomyces elasticus]
MPGVGRCTLLKAVCSQSNFARLPAAAAFVNAQNPLSRLGDISATGCHAPKQYQRFYASQRAPYWRLKLAQNEQPVPPPLPELEHYRAAVQTNLVENVTARYHDLKVVLARSGKQEELLNVGFFPRDLKAAAQILHNAYRRTSIKAVAQGQFVAFADELVKDIRRHTLPASATANHHILGFYRDAREFEKGYEFWAWLVRQDESYVSPTIYGTAIELLATQGESLENLEELYIQALKRFPGSFNEYHLSPEAIVPDRTQPADIYGIPMLLLQGIMTARLLHGDVQNAYLALDTALRLCPTVVPTRFFEVFAEERPLFEGFKVFLLACRAGIATGEGRFKALLYKLREVHPRAPFAQHVTAVRATFTAAYAYAGGGGQFKRSHLDELVIGLTGLLAHPCIMQLQTSKRAEVVDIILAMLRRTLEVFAKVGALPSMSSFNSIISNVAGKGRRWEAMPMALSDAAALGLKPTRVTERAIVTAAGELADQDLVAQSWSALVRMRESQGNTMEYADWKVLANACRLAGNVEYIKLQKEEQAHALTPDITSAIDSFVEWAKNGDAPEELQHIATFEQATEEVRKIDKDLDFIGERLKVGLVLDFRKEPLPMSLSGDRTDHSELTLPEPELRALYDELSTDPAQQSLQHDTQVAMSSDSLGTKEDISAQSIGNKPQDVLAVSAPELPAPQSSTGFPLDELRYENWKSINELLAEATRHDKAFQSAVDEAIAKGTKLPSRKIGWPRDDELTNSFGLSDFHPSSIETQLEANNGREDSKIRDDQMKIGRATVLRLRGRL